MSDQLLDDRLDMRINGDAKKSLLEKCRESGIPWQITMRQLITAHIEDRLTVKPKKKK